jgi:hypothetical protein
MDHERHARRHQPLASLADVIPVVRDRQVVHELASKIVARLSDHLGAMHAHPEAQWFAQHVDQHEMPQHIGAVERVDVSAGGKAPVPLLGSQYS